jgi:hypothetical protein
MAPRPVLAAVVLALVLSFPAVASAVALTPPVHNDTDRVGCVAQNRGKTPRTVTATLRDAAGVAIGSPFSLEIPPGLAIELVSTSAFQIGVYCEFEGTSRKVRGFLQVQPLGGGTTLLSLPAD